MKKKRIGHSNFAIVCPSVDSIDPEVQGERNEERTIQQNKTQRESDGPTNTFEAWAR